MGVSRESGGVLIVVECGAKRQLVLQASSPGAVRSRRRSTEETGGSFVWLWFVLWLQGAIFLERSSSSSSVSRACWTLGSIDDALNVLRVHRRGGGMLIWPLLCRNLRRKWVTQKAD